MTFEIPECPECGGDIAGTLERTPGIAEITRDADGNYEYGGYTKMDWDGQVTIKDKAGRVTVFCAQCDNEWQTKMEG